MSNYFQILLVCCLLFVTVSSITADSCIQKLEKLCRSTGPQDCVSVGKAETFKALVDCCSDGCTLDELARSCCAVLY